MAYQRTLSNMSSNHFWCVVYEKCYHKLNKSPYQNVIFDFLSWCNKLDFDFTGPLNHYNILAINQLCSKWCHTIWAFHHLCPMWHTIWDFHHICPMWHYNIWAIHHICPMWQYNILVLHQICQCNITISGVSPFLPHVTSQYMSPPHLHHVTTQDLSEHQLWPCEIIISELSTTYVQCDITLLQPSTTFAPWCIIIS